MNTPRISFDPVADLAQADGTRLHSSTRVFAVSEGSTAPAHRLLTTLAVTTENGKVRMRFGAVHMPVRDSRPAVRRPVQRGRL